MDANARTGRGEEGRVGSKDSKTIDAYGRAILNDDGELLLSFANNHNLVLVNTHPRAANHTLSTGEAKTYRLPVHPNEAS